MKLGSAFWGLALFAITTVRACGDCSAPQNEVVQTRLVRRMQPDAQNASSGPKTPLEWGQINFLQTTDTHGWLEGHIKEKNYGADWGDFVSFTSHMKKKAGELGVDLLLIDTGVGIRKRKKTMTELINRRIFTMEQVSVTLRHQMD
jgi:2',3'-cyclic-nucleotide 2'-phosphodiesterase (5'-nucleotidase family)